MKNACIIVKICALNNLLSIAIDNPTNIHTHSKHTHTHTLTQ